MRSLYPQGYTPKPQGTDLERLREERWIRELCAKYKVTAEATEGHPMFKDLNDLLKPRQR